MCKGKVLYTNGTIYTMQIQQPVVEAVLVEGERILAVGRRAALEPEADTIISLQGNTMFPAFLDSHGHLMGVANGMLQVDLSEVYCYAEMKEKILNFIQTNHVSDNKWVFAKGINHANLKEKQLPTKSILDEICPQNPLVVQHASGHSAICNTLGLQTLGITADTKNPVGGKIDFLRGLLEETAWVTYMKRLPLSSLQELEHAFQRAQQIYASYGITTIQEGMFVPEILPIYQMLYQKEKLNLDVVAYLDLQHADQFLDAFLHCRGVYDRHFKIGGYKVILDGSPQSKTAWVTEPYDDGTKGYPALQDKDLSRLVARAVREKQQLLMHANGDAAIDQYLRVYEAVKKEWGPAIRPVLIHGQLLRYDQIEKMTQLGIIPSFFVAHVYHWGDIHVQQLGKYRAEHISPAHTALAYGLPFTLHQDAPVIQPDMLETIWCAATRCTKEGRQLGGIEKLTVYEAIQSVTKHAAMQYGELQNKGTIEKGKFANFVIMNQDPLCCDVAQIRNIHILQTIQNGKCIFNCNG